MAEKNEAGIIKYNADVMRNSGKLINLETKIKRNKTPLNKYVIAE